MIVPNNALYPALATMNPAAIGPIAPIKAIAAYDRLTCRPRLPAVVNSAKSVLNGTQCQTRKATIDAANTHIIQCTFSGDMKKSDA